jgi:structural maintenance of chromosome 2
VIPSTLNQATHATAVQKLNEERAVLSRFDNELKDLESAIKEHKQAISEAELSQKTILHEVQALQRDRSQAQNFLTGLEKQFEWIAEENK